MSAFSFLVLLHCTITTLHYCGIICARMWNAANYYDNTKLLSDLWPSILTPDMLLAFCSTFLPVCEIMELRRIIERIMEINREAWEVRMRRRPRGDVGTRRDVTAWMLYCLYVSNKHTVQAGGWKIAVDTVGSARWRGADRMDEGNIDPTRKRHTSPVGTTNTYMSNPRIGSVRHGWAQRVNMVTSPLWTTTTQPHS